MKKRILILALALSMTLEPVAAVYGAEFSSGMAEEIPQSAWEEEKEWETSEIITEQAEPQDEAFFLEDFQEADTTGDIAEPADADPVSEEPADTELTGTEIIDAEIFTAGDTEPAESTAAAGGEILSTIDFRYQIRNAEITIVEYIGSSETVEIPETMDGYPVTGIGEKAFFESGITGIQLPAGLKYIGAEAFAGCAAITTLELPAAVAEIGENAFASCPKLVLICSPESYAQQYAEANKLPYELTEEEKTDIAKCTVTMAASAVCTGEALTPAVEIKNGEQILVSGQDYTVEYRDNINPGTGTAVITGMGVYTGTFEKSFTITLAAPVLVSAKSASYRSVKVTWKAVPGAEAYNVYYKGDTIKSWKRVKTKTTETSFVHTSSKSCPLVTGKKYTYTVKAVMGKTLSKADEKGKTATPSLATVKLGTVKSAAYNKS